MLPKELSWQDRFALARAVGFDGIEMQTVSDQAEAEAIAKASEATGLVIHSVMNSDHWRYPLSSPDPEVVRKSVAGMKTSLMNAALVEGRHRAAGAGRRRRQDQLRRTRGRDRCR